MADINGTSDAKVNGAQDPAGTTPVDASKEEPLTNGEQSVVQQESQPADVQPAAIQPVEEAQIVPNAAPAQTEPVMPAETAAPAEPTEPDSRPAVLIIGGLGM